MIETFTVSFFGHRVLDNSLAAERELEHLIHELLGEKEYVEFLTGRNGAFDQLVSSTIHRTKRVLRDDNSSHVLVLAYPTAEYLNNKGSFGEYYDEIEIYQSPARTHFKSAIQMRNKAMVDRSDFVVCWIEHNHGGAYQTMKYAQQQGKEILNLAELPNCKGG